MNAEEAARRYYEAIDGGDDDSLAALLHPEFTHDRPDRTLSGRDAFVRFMREERPRTDTVHEVGAVYRETDAGDGDGHDDAGDAVEVVVRGRLRTEDGEDLFSFVDVFRVADGTVHELTTYTDSHPER
ncbi:nuclear transport factor 2 family protein [Halorarum halobium]|uniref:nuclear transport factor 2 family protein n=1 Tax=Halorarum halobium TaxID=3075121 RepID=UPI0028A9CCD0|nr:nuclear transport factor 2 family protein [Halobaculum sp. XH14]